MALEAPWFERAFGEDYLRVYAHRDDAQACREVEELAGRLSVGSSCRLLDVGCGAGRHLAAWAQRGVQGVGVDRSSALLRVARQRGGKVVRADMRALPFAASSFELVTLLFTTFGYFEDSSEDARMLAETARVLVPGGRIVLDLADPEDVRAHLVPRTERMVGMARITEERRMVGQRVVKTVAIREDAVTRGWHESVRLYTADEARALLAVAGLRWRACLTNLDTSSSAVRHVHVAERG